MHLTYHDRKPDLDNLEKSVLDAMTGVFFVDDSLVCDVHASKLWSLNPAIAVDIMDAIDPELEDAYQRYRLDV